MAGKITLLHTFIMMHLKTMRVYKKDFLIGLVVSLITVVFDLLFLKVVFSHVDQIGGWTEWQLMFLYGMVTVNLAMFQMLYGNLRSLKGYLFSGEMERILWQPCCPLFAVRFRALSVAPLNRLIVGMTVLMVYGSGRVNWSEVGVAFMYSAVGVSSLASIMVLASSVLFYTHYLYTPYDNITEILKYIHYPLSIFPPGVFKVLTLGLPFAFLGYLPAKGLIYAEWELSFLIYGIVFAIVAKMLSNRVFRKALSRFEGSNI